MEEKDNYIADNNDKFIGTELITQKGGILKILYHNGLKGNKKKYYYSCSICSIDTDLFPSLFSSTKNDLLRESVNCGCSSCKRYTKQEYEIKLQRKAKSLNHTFHRIVEGSKNINKRSKIVLSCKTHYCTWKTTDIDHYLNSDRLFCPECAKTKISEARLVEDEVFINKFLSTGCFVEGTTFKRDNTRQNKAGYFPYWKVYCPDCNTENSAFYGSLFLGSLPCACFRKNQNIFYINLIIDNGKQIALKFGIETTKNRRLLEQQNVTRMKVVRILELKFDNSTVKDIEKQIKQCVNTKVLTKEQYPDGYTETTDICNYSKIIQIINNCTESI